MVKYLGAQNVRPATWRIDPPPIFFLFLCRREMHDGDSLGPLNNGYVCELSNWKFISHIPHSCHGLAIFATDMAPSQRVISRGWVEWAEHEESYMALGLALGTVTRDMKRRWAILLIPFNERTNESSARTLLYCIMCAVSSVSLVLYVICSTVRSTWCPKLFSLFPLSYTFHGRLLVAPKVRAYLTRFA